MNFVNIYFASHVVNRTSKIKLHNNLILTMLGVIFRVYRYIYHMCFISKEVVDKIYELGRIEGNPDVEEIIKVLNNEYQKQEDKSRFLIFVKTRMTAKALAEKLPEEFNSRHLTGSQVSKEEGGIIK